MTGKTCWSLPKPLIPPGMIYLQTNGRRCSMTNDEFAKLNPTLILSNKAYPFPGLRRLKRPAKQLNFRAEKMRQRNYD